MQKRPGKRTITIATPNECEKCNPKLRQRWGCGCSDGIPWTAVMGGDGYIGQGRIWSRDKLIRERQATPEDRTCPQWFRRSPFYLSLLEELNDYKQGRLGNVRETMPYAVLVYLRCLAAESDAWDAHWMAIL